MKLYAVEWGLIEAFQVCTRNLSLIHETKTEVYPLPLYMFLVSLRRKAPLHYIQTCKAVHTSPRNNLHPSVEEKNTSNDSKKIKEAPRYIVELGI